MERGQNVPRVAIVYHFFAHYRGAVVQALLDSDKYHVLFVGDRRDPTDSGIEPWVVSKPDRFIDGRCRMLFGRLMIQSGLIRLALRRDLSAIIYLGNAEWPMTWLSAALARVTGKRVLFWTHGWNRWESGLKAFVRRRFYRLGHGMLLYGHLAKVIGIAQGFAPEKLHVIYNSLDYPSHRAARERITESRLQQVRSELFENADRPLVICSSRLTHVRRLDLLLEALDHLRQQGHHVNLLLIGAGAERDSLRRMAKERSLDVHFYGPCYDVERLAEFTMAANVTVSPGAIGLTAIQSLSFGTPVITHDDPFDQGPEWEAIIPGRTGALFRKGDVRGLAETIRLWTMNRLTSDEVRADCFRIVERFYNPDFQRRAIERALDGAPADDLFWAKPGADESPVRSASGMQQEDPP